MATSSTRPRIPAEVEREIFIQAGHRCAVCGESLPLDRAHIIPWRESREHRVEDLICLCANCHRRADVEKWGQPTLREYKQRPWVSRRFEVHPASTTTDFRLSNEPLDDRLVPERFSQAVEHLGSQDLLVRVGGIYALEKIAKQAPIDYHWTVMELLCSFVRERSRKRPKGPSEEHPEDTWFLIPFDIQSSLAVLGRRDTSDETEDQRIDLRGANLNLAEPHGAKFNKALFHEASLELVAFTAAELRDAVFFNASLAANLANADLTSAKFGNAKLAVQADGANFHKADLSRAQLRGSDLRGAKNLTQEQLESAYGDIYIQLPATNELKHPQHWDTEAEVMIKNLEHDLAAKKKALGPAHAVVGRYHDQLGDWCSSQGRDQEAESHFLQAIENLKETLGPSHSDLGKSLYHLARLYAKQGRNEEARTRYQQARVILEEACGPDDPLVIRILAEILEAETTKLPGGDP